MEFLNYLSTNFPDGFIYVSLVWFIWIVARFYFVRFGGVEEAVKEQKKVHRSIIAKLDNIEKTLDRVVRYLSTRDSVEINHFTDKVK